MLVHLVRHLLDVVELAARGGGGIALDRVAVGVEFRLALGGAGAALLAGQLTFGRLFGESLFLGS